jgi:hypothetical protein
MGTSKRPNTGGPSKKAIIMPGPGTYKPVDPKMSVSTKFSIGSREKNSNKRLKLTELRILPNGSHEKISVFQSEAPGPGTYTA